MKTASQSQAAYFLTCEYEWVGARLQSDILDLPTSNRRTSLEIWTEFGVSFENKFNSDDLFKTKADFILWIRQVLLVYVNILI